MHDDPFETRDRGLRRVHAVTASVAAAALLGTGVIVYELAAPAQANAEQTVQPGQTGDDQQVLPQRGDDGDEDGGGGFQAPIQPPVQQPVPVPRGGRGHASSGGS